MPNTEAMDTASLHREIISRLLLTGETSIDVQQIKLEVCRRLGCHRIPKNSEILGAAEGQEREVLRSKLRLKPGRTISGVSPVAVMTSPHPCPHGKCLFCPGGPDHEFMSPQSYTGEEPAALRGREHGFDPFSQVHARLSQFSMLGHHVDKVELIVMGGTITARASEYQEEFVRSCLEAMNRFPSPLPGERRGLRAEAARNERARVRCVALTFETRPDRCGREEIERMLSLGVTKVELGVQHLDDRVLEQNLRGCRVEDAVEANRLLRNAGLKVGFHMMPNLPGSTLEEDRRMFQDLFSDPRFRPDFLKIYPTLVTRGTGIEELWRRGEYEVYPEEELVNLLAFAKAHLPEYVRLQRIQRDIPAKLILAGSRHGNLRQLAAARLESQGMRCRCIRCREAGRRGLAGGEIGFRIQRYRCTDGEELFISAESGDALVGFARVRAPQEAFLPILEGAALLRELHVYGGEVRIGERPAPGEWQHRRVGLQLLSMAEEAARDMGHRTIAVMSGIGARPYYRRHGYRRSGPFMLRRLG